MSPITTYLLLLLFLCFSLHACNARRLSTSLVHHKKLEKKTHFSIKNDNNKCLDLSPKQLGSRNGGDKKKQTGLVGEAEKPRIDDARRRTNQRVLKSKGRKTTSGSSSQQNHNDNDNDHQLSNLGVSVSWRVPHHDKKKGNKNPEFNLDYSPPKTHPPSHN